MFLLNALLQATVGRTAGVDDLTAVDDMTAVDGLTAGVKVPPAVCCQHSEWSDTVNFLAIFSILDSTSLLCLKIKMKSIQHQ